jgi:hypothetical protein
MAFAASFTITQSIDGATISLVDTSNYGDGGAFHKADMVSRVLYITRGDDLIEVTNNFPYTNTTDSLQDIFTFTEDQDYVYSIRMVLTDNVAVEYTATNQVITTEYTLKKLRTILSEEGCGCNCNNNCALVQQIQCGLDAASARTCAADISGAQQILSQINEVADNHINCC